VVLGDDRRWQEVRIDRVATEALGELDSLTGVEEQIAIVLAEPAIDALERGVRSAATPG
jgi:hypothetical protein